MSATSEGVILVVKAIILAAGMGTRMGTLGTVHPKCMLTIGDSTILQSQICELQRNGISEIHVVIGYKKELVQPHAEGLGAETHENPSFATVGMLESLMNAKRVLIGDVVVLYGDIFLTEGALSWLMHAKGDIVLAANFSTKRVKKKSSFEFEGYYGTSLPKGASLLQIVDGRVTSISKSVCCGSDEALAEYVGIFRLSSKGSALLVERIEHCIRNGSIEQYPSPSYLFSALLSEGCRIDAYPLSDQSYAECDTEADLERARSRFSSS